MLVVVYAVAMSFLFLYGLEDKLHHLAEHAKAWENTSCKLGDDYDAECLGQEGVFRINLAVVAFFASNWLGCKLSKQWHNALWIVKMVFFLAIVLLRCSGYPRHSSTTTSGLVESWPRYMP